MLMLLLSNNIVIFFLKLIDNWQLQSNVDLNLKLNLFSCDVYIVEDFVSFRQYFINTRDLYFISYNINMVAKKIRIFSQWRSQRIVIHNIVVLYHISLNDIEMILFGYEISFWDTSSIPMDLFINLVSTLIGDILDLVKSQKTQLIIIYDNIFI